MKDELLQAIDLALSGEWDAAHGVVQRLEGDSTAAWIHAVLHKIEGDLGNSRYWYRQAGRPAAVEEDPRGELARIKAQVASTSP